MFRFSKNLLQKSPKVVPLFLLLLLLLLFTTVCFSIPLHTSTGHKLSGIQSKSKFRSLITKFSIKFQNFKTLGARRSLAPIGQQLSVFEILKFFGNHSRIFITIKLFCLKTFTMSRAGNFFNTIRKSCLNWST